MALPFNLAPAPVVQQFSKPIDLGEFDGRYAGWIVVFNLNAPMSMNDYIATATDNDANMRDRNSALEEWTKAVCAGWNFVNDAGDPIAQPQDGGFKALPQALLGPISEAFAREMQPKKA